MKKEEVKGERVEEETMEKVWGEMWDAGGQWKKVSGKEIKRTEGGEGMTHTGPVACMRVPICVCVCVCVSYTLSRTRKRDGMTS